MAIKWGDVAGWMALGCLAIAGGLSGCGDDSGDDDDGGGGGLCARMAEDDDRCAGGQLPPQLYVCETDAQSPPSGDCEPLGDSGDYCCPGASGSGGSGGSGGGSSGGTGGAEAGAGGAAPATWWTPAAGVTWDWQLGDEVDLDLSHDVEVYDVDWEFSASVVDELHGNGIQVLCYVSVGSSEAFRPDAADFPAETLGTVYPGWEDEVFVDIRSDAVRDIMAARFDECRDKGFDAIEPDNMDVFEADSGFPLTEADGLDYALWLADQAHQRGMAIVMKNTSGLTDDLVDVYDGALTEDCFFDNWCEEVLAFAAAGKPVFMAEYTDTGVDFAAACTYAAANDYSAILKDRDLTADLQTCP